MFSIWKMENISFLSVHLIINLKCCLTDGVVNLALLEQFDGGIQNKHFYYG